MQDGLDCFLDYFLMFVSCLNVDPLGMHTVMACQNGKYRTSLDNITYFLEKARMQFFF